MGRRSTPPFFTRCVTEDPLMDYQFEFLLYVVYAEVLLYVAYTEVLNYVVYTLSRY